MAYVMAPLRLSVAAAATARAVCLVAVAVLVALTGTAEAAGSGSFTPTSSSCTSGQCPNVTWSNYTAGGPGAFTIVSSPRTGSSNYLSFAFATGVEMEDAILVVDCYEPNGTATIGTSLNTGSPLDNSDRPELLIQLSNVTATRNAGGVLTCSFTMNFPSSSAVYIFLAEGTMSNPGGSPPKKRQHDAEYVSPQTLGVMMGLQANGAAHLAVETRHLSVAGSLLLLLWSLVVSCC